MPKAGRTSTNHVWQPQALLASPLFAPLHSLLRQMPEQGFPSLALCNALLAAHQPAITVNSGQVVHFVPQAPGKLSFEAQYEPRAYLTGAVQTREDNWHDLLNALVWLAFPKSKAAINVRHYRALTIEAAPTVDATSQRGAVRDTTTLLDESGVLVACADANLADALRDFRWHELFWQQRGRLRSRMGFFLLGHGLYEKALQPYVGMTGQGLVLPVAPVFFDWPAEQQLVHLDALLADYLAVPGHCRSTRELTPVPILGVPGWAAENEREEYYRNTAYFRPGRRA